MIWIGLILGFIIGFITAVVFIRKLMYYLGEHPELISQMVDEATRKFTDVIFDELKKKLDEVEKARQYHQIKYGTNPFKVNEINTTVQTTINNIGGN